MILNILFLIICSLATMMGPETENEVFLSIHSRRSENGRRMMDLARMLMIFDFRLQPLIRAPMELKLPVACLLACSFVRIVRF